MIDDVVRFGSPSYFVLLAFLAMARSMDLLSTWIATPNLALEANPIARWLGWRWGTAVSLVICLAAAFWPLPAVIIITASLLVAARNFQSAWLMRSMGENEYRSWILSRYLEARRGLFLFCLVAHALLVAAVGGALILFSEWRLIPFGVGAGIIAYSLAVVLYTLISASRVWRGSDPRGSSA